MSAARGAVLSVALVVACATSAPVQRDHEAKSAPVVPARAAPACSTARELVARADRLVAEGRLRQALRASARARALCPDRGGPLSAAVKAAVSELAQPTSDPLELMTRGVAEKQAQRQAQGQRLIDRALSALERRTGASARIVVPPAADPDHFALSPDAAFVLATNWERKETDVLDAGTGRQRARFQSQNTAVVEGGRSVAVALVDGAVEIIDLGSGAIEQTLVGGNTRLAGVETDPKGERLVVSGDALVVWELPSGRRLLALEGPHVFAFAGNGRIIAYADSGGSVVTLHDLEQGKAVAHIDARGWVRDEGLAVSPDGRLVAMAVRAAAGGPRNEFVDSVSVHDTHGNKTIRLAGQGRSLMFTHTTPPRLVTVSRHEAKVWDLQTRNGKALANKCSWDGVHAASGEVLCTRDGTLLLVDPAGHERRLFQPARHEVTASALGAAVPRVATLHGDARGARLRVFDLEQSKSVLDVRVGQASSVALSADGGLIALGGRDGGELRDARSGQVIHAIERPKPLEQDAVDPEADVAVRFRPDGQALAAFTTGAANLIETTTGKVFASLGPAAGLAFSPDSKAVAHGGYQHFWLADARTGKPIGDSSVLEVGGSVRQLAFSWDSRRVLVGSFRALREYDVALGRPPRLLWYGEAQGLAALPSDALAVAAGGLLRFIERDGQVRHLAIPAEDLQTNGLGYVLARAGSGLTVLNERVRARSVRLEAVLPSFALIARAPTGEVELIDPDARDGLRCQVGAVVHPLELCEDELVTTGLVASVAHAAAHRPIP